MNNTALVLIDIQNDYFEGGALTLQGPVQAAENAKKLLVAFRDAKRPVIHIQHAAASQDLGFMIPGTRGQEIYAGVAPHSDEPVLTKHYPNSFWETALETTLHELEVEHVVIAGMMTHMCVSTTTRGAMERGFQATVIQNACATKSLELGEKTIPADVVHETALAELTMLADIKPLEDFLAEM
ncbi:cysteine hydrolase family protein [Vibrio nigripulchritudo]|uniref:cysteine hydrolase family protein n=1 Tax=Vibrio nigripulchritudo TaxID=28173 RepID=UPI0003B22DFE|nr:cysteine hydrolase family protein [Vibrio nigripulchritudo]CCN68263.1 putative Isochorismatase [Vibrio nigripulchritudo SFn118]